MKAAQPELERPWGRERVLGTGPGVRIRMLLIDAGKATPVARHGARVAQWTVLSGAGQVFYGRVPEKLLRKDLMQQNLFFVGQHEWHSVRARGKPIVMLVVEWGMTLEVDDLEVAELEEAGA